MGFLFKKKKDDDFNMPDAPFMPSNLPGELPPLPPPPKAPGLKKELGLSDFELPPLPRDLPPLPRLEKRSLPPLPNFEEEEFEEPELPPVAEPQPRIMPRPAPAIAPQERATKVYVRLDKYRNILKSVGQMEAKLNELHQTLSRLNAVKDKETEVIGAWVNLLEDAKRTLDEVHERMPKAEEA